MVDVFGLRFDLAAFEEVARGAAAEAAHTEGSRELAVTLITLGIPALIAALMLAGVRGARPLGLIALGVVPIAVVFFAHVQSHDPSACHDCYSALGGAYHPIELAATTFNIVAWTVGALVGLVVRSFADRLSPTSRIARSSR